MSELSPIDIIAATLAREGGWTTEVIKTVNALVARHAAPTQELPPPLLAVTVKGGVVQRVFGNHPAINGINVAVFTMDPNRALYEPEDLVRLEGEIDGAPVTAPVAVALMQAEESTADFLSAAESRAFQWGDLPPWIDAEPVSSKDPAP